MDYPTTSQESYNIGTEASISKKEVYKRSRSKKVIMTNQDVSITDNAYFQSQV